jgi:preprotein translocase subunit YajC
MFISPAYAQGAGAPGGLGGLEGLLPLILIFVVFYFLLIRPQQKKMKEHKAMLEAVRRGDKVVTGGGIIGTVTKVVSDDELQVEIADGVKVRVQRGTVSQVLSKTEPAKAEASPANDDKGAAEGKSAGDKLKGLLGGKKD